MINYNKYQKEVFARIIERGGKLFKIQDDIVYATNDGYSAVIFNRRDFCIDPDYSCQEWDIDKYFERKNEDEQIFATDTMKNIGGLTAFVLKGATKTVYIQSKLFELIKGYDLYAHAQDKRVLATTADGRAVAIVLPMIVKE